MSDPEALLGLSAEEVAALDPADLERAIQRAELSFATARAFNKLQWDILVERHNDLTPEERAARRAVCARRGRHDWVRLPMRGCRVCRRCLQYESDA